MLDGSHFHLGKASLTLYANECVPSIRLLLRLFQYLGHLLFDFVIFACT